MSLQVAEQATHERINLLRLVKRLEKSIDNREWLEDTQESSRATWIKTQGVLQKVKDARKWLKNIELNEDMDETSLFTQRYEELRRTLDRLEHVVQDVNQRVAPKATRPPSILHTLPIPPPTARPALTPAVSGAIASNPVLSIDPATDLAAQDLLLSPSDTLPLPSSSLPVETSPLLPAEPPAGFSERPSIKSSASVGAPSFLQNSAALQEEMSEQLANMAAQLKRNAIHFATSLEKDKAVVLEAQEKVERNYDVMTKERVRLRDHRSKSWGTTWLVILSLVVALVGFMLTFFVIRLT